MSMKGFSPATAYSKDIRDPAAWYPWRKWLSCQHPWRLLLQYYNKFAEGDGWSCLAGLAMVHNDWGGPQSTVPNEKKNWMGSNDGTCWRSLPDPWRTPDSMRVIQPMRFVFFSGSMLLLIRENSWACQLSIPRTCNGSRFRSCFFVSVVQTV